MSINTRFELIIEALFKGKQNAFAAAIGVAPSVVNNVVGKRQGKPSFDLIEKISSIAELNIDWLITGQGKMLKQSTSTTDSGIIPSNSSIKNLRITSRSDQDSGTQVRPRIPLDAAAGCLSYFTEGVALEDCEMFPVIKTLPQYDFTIFANGDSMSPDILSGDELACRFIHESTFIQWGRIYVLDTTQGVVVKRLFEKGSRIIGRSINKEYPDYPIDKTDILHMALVVGLIRQF